MLQLTRLLMLAALLGLSLSQAQLATQPNLDLTRLLGTGRHGEPILTVLNRNLPQVQQMIDSHKQRCLSKLQLPANQRALIHEPKPTEQEKCLMECVFKSIRLMDGNKLNLQRVQQLASQVTDNNAMAVALSSTLAQSCNRLVRSSKPCEAAHQLNQCIAKHMERNRVKLSW